VIGEQIYLGQLSNLVVGEELGTIVSPALLAHFIREAMWIELMGGDEAVGLA